MASNNPFVDLLVEAIEKIAIAKYIAVVALTFYAYDFLITLDAEIKYVWGAKWSFGRVAFHFNRCWSILVLCIYMPTIFSHGVDVKTCRTAITFYGDGVIFLFLNTTVVMSMRVWILFNRNIYVLILLSVACLSGLLGCLLVFHLQLKEMIQIPNPAPELITGCLTILPKIVTRVPYVIGLTLDTAIFVATLWKTLALNRSGVRLPIIKCLVRDGTIYYLINCASLAAALLLSIDTNLNNIALGSGYIIALHSTLCTRILLSLHVFNDKASGNVTRLNGTTAKDVESGNVKTVFGNVTTQRPDSPLELEVMKRHD